MSLWANFQNHCRQFPNSSFDRKFYTEKLFNRTFLMKWACDEIWRHKITKNVHFIKKCPVITFFSIKFPIEWAIWQLSTIILKFFEKNFQWGRVFENRGAVREISTDFQSENGFDLTKNRRIEMRGLFWSRAYFLIFPLSNSSP